MLIGDPRLPTVLDVKKLVGECSGCGLCCAGRYQGRSYRCEHLVVTKPLGQPHATTCKVYAQRVDGLPVLLLDAATNQPMVLGCCFKDSADETATIISQGIGRGCSLVLVDR